MTLPKEYLTKGLTVKNIIEQAQKMGVHITIDENLVQYIVTFGITGPQPSRRNMIDWLEGVRPWGIPFIYKEYDKEGSEQ